MVCGELIYCSMKEPPARKSDFQSKNLVEPAFLCQYQYQTLVDMFRPAETTPLYFTIINAVSVDIKR